MHKIIPVAGPWITEKEISYVTDAVTNGWYQHANDYINKFELAFKTYLGRKHAISLPSCTSAIHLSLLSLDIGPGDEVIVPDATWIASAAPISYVGATPIFADIDPHTWCISAETVKPLLTKKTKAILAVNLYGHMPEYDDLLSLGVPVIEDAAESIGSLYKGRLSGNFGITSCFSFHGSKTLTTGEGGMIVTDDDKLYERCMMLRDHGRLPGDTLFQNIEIGYKYKMSNLQAALGLAQLERVSELISRKRQIFQWYNELFEDINFVDLNPKHMDVINSYWMVTATFKKDKSKDKFYYIKKLLDQGVSTRPFFSPLSSLKAYTKFEDVFRAKNSNSNAYSISRFSLNFPSSLNLTKKDVVEVSRIVLALL